MLVGFCQLRRRRDVVVGWLGVLALLEAGSRRDIEDQWVHLSVGGRLVTNARRPEEIIHCCRPALPAKTCVVAGQVLERPVRAPYTFPVRPGARNGRGRDVS